MNAPASAFGHTLLRINKDATAKSGKRFELLDQGINFAAVMTTQNPVIYAVKGVFGFFRGTFTSVPYYFKVREYNDHEKRDLWEYDLNLTQSEMDLMVAHVWELGPSYYDYYYLDENCSYHMLTILEAAAPRLHLVDQLPSIVIPVDTVRALYNEKDFVTNIQFRPSVYRQFDTRLQRLSASDARWLKKIVAAKDAGQVAGAPVEVLSMPIKWIFLIPRSITLIMKSKELRDGDAGALAWKQNVLQARSAILKPGRELAPYPKGDEPHAGHHSRRVGLGVTANSAGGCAGCCQVPVCAARSFWTRLLDTPKVGSSSFWRRIEIGPGSGSASMD